MDNNKKNIDIDIQETQEWTDSFRAVIKNQGPERAHFFRGPEHKSGGDLIFFQGHSVPRVYARPFLEDRLSKKKLINFRRELANGGAYPYPWLMPDYWQFTKQGSLII